MVAKPSCANPAGYMPQRFDGARLAEQGVATRGGYGPKRRRRARPMAGPPCHQHLLVAGTTFAKVLNDVEAGQAPRACMIATPTTLRSATRSKHSARCSRPLADCSTGTKFEWRASGRWDLGVDQKAQSRGPQDGVVVLSGGKLQHGGDVLGPRVRIVRQNLFARGSARKEVEHVLHTEAQTTNRRTTAAHIRAQCDSVKRAHGGSVT